MKSFLKKYKSAIASQSASSWGNVRNSLFTKETNRRPYLRVIKESKIKLFKNIYQCSEFLKEEPEVIFESMKTLKPINGWYVTAIYRGDKEALKYMANDPISVNGDSSGKFENSRKRKLDVLDLHTNEIKTYRCILEAARSHGVGITHIRNNISKGEKQSIFNRRYVIVESGTGFDWVTEEVKKKLLARGSKKVILVEFNDNEKSANFIIYKSASSMIKMRGWGNKRARIAEAVKVYECCQYDKCIFMYAENCDNDPSLEIILKMIVPKTVKMIS